MKLPGWESLLQGALVRRLESAGGRGLPLEALAAEEGPPASSQEVAGALRALERRGEAAEVDGRWRLLRHSDHRIGVVDAIEESDALIRLPGEREAAFFVPRRRLRGALEGDVVLLREAAGRGRRRGRRAGDLPEASVTRIVSFGHPRVVGTLEIDEIGRRWLVPFDPKIGLEVEVLEAEHLLEDHYVVVEVERGGEPKRHPRGKVVRVLGDARTPGVDVAVVLEHYGIPEAFPREVEEEAAALPPDPPPADLEGREDLRDRVVVTIDGAGARDFDDAVSVEERPAGGFRLGVHIADVSHYVQPRSALDREAYRRGTSVYYPERAVPMLPEGLSNGLCSLRPGVPRLTFSVFLDVDAEGRVLSRRFARTVIESRRRLTYEEVRRLLEEPAREDPGEYGPVLSRLAAMKELMEALYRRRRDRGSIDFDLPSGDVILDTDGTTVGIRPGERMVSHRIIEELMIAANEAVAEELASRGMPALYRVHDPPLPEALRELREILATVGIRLRGDLSDLQPGELQAVMDRVAGRPQEGFVGSLVLRAMTRASYSPECRGHYALAAPFYTHFTSPIRRYPDLLVHRSLAALLSGAAPEATLADRLPAIADHASSTERRAEASERDLLQWKKVRFLADRVGDRFSGRITGVQPFGLFVQLDGMYVDGLVPIRALGDDYYVYEPDAHRLVGDARGRVFRLGDSLEVTLTGVSERHRGLDLEPASLGEPPRRRRGQKGGRRRRRSRGHHTRGRLS